MSDKICDATYLIELKTRQVKIKVSKMLRSVKPNHLLSYTRSELDEMLEEQVGSPGIRTDLQSIGSELFTAMKRASTKIINKERATVLIRLDGTDTSFLEESVFRDYTSYRLSELSDSRPSTGDVEVYSGKARTSVIKNINKRLEFSGLDVRVITREPGIVNKRRDLHINVTCKTIQDSTYYSCKHTDVETKHDRYLPTYIKVILLGNSMRCTFIGKEYVVLEFHDSNVEDLALLSERILLAVRPVIVAKNNLYDFALKVAESSKGDDISPYTWKAGVGFLVGDGEVKVDKLAATQRGMEVSNDCQDKVYFNNPYIEIESFCIDGSVRFDRRIVGTTGKIHFYEDTASKIYNNSGKYYRTLVYKSKSCRYIECRSRDGTILRTIVYKGKDTIKSIYEGKKFLTTYGESPIYKVKSLENRLITPVNHKLKPDRNDTGNDFITEVKNYDLVPASPEYDPEWQKLGSSEYYISNKLSDNNGLIEAVVNAALGTDEMGEEEVIRRGIEERSKICSGILEESNSIKGKYVWEIAGGGKLVTDFLAGQDSYLPGTYRKTVCRSDKEVEMTDGLVDLIAEVLQVHIALVVKTRNRYTYSLHPCSSDTYTVIIGYNMKDQNGYCYMSAKDGSKYTTRFDTEEMDYKAVRRGATETWKRFKNVSERLEAIEMMRCRVYRSVGRRLREQYLI